MRWRSVCCCLRLLRRGSTKLERRLPPDYQDILSRAVSPLKYQSKEELHSLLCEGILKDKGTKWFSLEKETGKTCYLIGGRNLHVCWSHNEQYFRWIALSGSRLPEVTELIAVCWLEIVGSIDSTKLSSKTTYGAYLILKFVYDGEEDGLDKQPAQISVQVGGTLSSTTAYLRPNKNVHLLRGRLQYLYEMQVLSTNHSESIQQEEEIKGGDGDGKLVEEESLKGVAKPKGDGWMEIELGRFFIDGNAGTVDMKILESGGHWKRGLIIEGIEVRPLD